MESNSQTEIGKLAVEVHKNKAALKKSHGAIVTQIAFLLVSVFWLVFSVATRLGNSMVLIGVALIVLDGFALIKTVVTYGILKSDTTKLEDEIAEKRHTDINASTKASPPAEPIQQGSGSFFFCPQCGNKLVDSPKFCHICGESAVMEASPPAESAQQGSGSFFFCPQCGNKVMDSMNFCPICGEPTATEA